MTNRFRAAKKWVTNRVIPDYTNQLDLFSEAPIEASAPSTDAPVRTYGASTCQVRLKIPHCTGRKFPSPREVVVYKIGWPMQDSIQPVKRRRAMQECNPPRNSWLQTHQDDGPQGGAGHGFALGFWF